MARYRNIEQDGRAHNEEQEAWPKRDQAVKGAHWQTSAVMVTSTIVGTAFAIAHDRFYHHFDGRAVQSDLEQKVIVNVGTAFAFLVKMFFCISAATVFSQQLFQTLRHKAESVEDLDALFDIFGNVLNFRKVALWLRHFVLAVIAVVVWVIPIAAVFTPGTIHVQPGLRYDNSTSLKPAQPQQSWIGTQNFGQTQIDYTALHGDGTHTYADAILQGPSGTLYSVALGSVSRRDILPIPPPNQNSSYELSFFAPALSCDSLPAQDVSNFEKSLAVAGDAGYLPSQQTILGSVESAKGLVVKYNAWIQSRYWATNLSHPSWNNGTNDQVYPDIANNQYFYFHPTGNSFMLACHLHNATYNAGFTFQNSEQTIDIKSTTLHELVALNQTVDVDNPDYYNVVYNSIYYAFNNIVINMAVNDTVTESPNVLYYGPGIVYASALRDLIEGSASVSTPTLAITTLEAIFHNITLSTLSAPSLRLSNAQASLISTNIWRTVNIYVYGPHDLYIAYGCALLATLLCVAWGLFLVRIRNRVSYSLKFSTIMRTTRRKEIDGVVELSARRGEDKLPQEIRSVKLKYSEDDGFAVVSSREMENMAGAQGNAHDRSASDFTFLPEIPSSDWDVGGRDGHKVRRKPVPHAETRTYHSLGSSGTTD